MEPAAEDVDLSDAKKSIEAVDDEDARDVEDAQAMLTMPDVSKVDLINWEEYARPTECALVTVALLLVIMALNGHDWLSGATGQGKMIVVGLLGAREGNAAPYALGPVCDALGAAAASNSSSVVCALAKAGHSASLFGSLALGAALVLAATFAIEAMANRGLLTSFREKLPAALPLDKVSAALPAVCWSLLLVLTLFTLLLYAARSPNSLGGGYVRLGLSYGLLRLSLVVSLLGLLVHLSLVHKLGEDAMINALDALRGSWDTLVLRQKATMLLLYLALAMELLLWIRRVEWGCLVLLYGLWAYTHRHHDHLCAFCALALFSLGTDAIALAHEDSAVSPLVPLATWLLIVSKCAAAGLMIYYKDAFA